MPWCMCGGQRTHCGSQFLPLAIWITGLNSRLRLPLLSGQATSLGSQLLLLWSEVPSLSFEISFGEGGYSLKVFYWTEFTVSGVARQCPWQDWEAVFLGSLSFVRWTPPYPIPVKCRRFLTFKDQGRETRQLVRLDQRKTLTEPALVEPDLGGRVSNSCNIIPRNVPTLATSFSSLSLNALWRIYKCMNIQ